MLAVKNPLHIDRAAKFMRSKNVHLPQTTKTALGVSSRKRLFMYTTTLTNTELALAGRDVLAVCESKGAAQVNTTNTPRKLSVSTKLLEKRSQENSGRLIKNS